MPPADIYAWNILLAPVLLLFVHWARPKFSWLLVFFISAPVSWFLTNSLLWIDPPDNGFVSVVTMALGWIWLLPVCAFLWLLEWIGFKMLRISKDSPAIRVAGKVGSFSLGLLMLALTAYGFFGRISAATALERADYILKQNKYTPTQPDPPQWIDGHWVIRYPHSTFNVIGLDRNGHMSWIDGP